MSSKQLDNYTANNVRLTLAEIFRDDQFGQWSFKEIGFRLQESHPNFITNHTNFDLIEIPRQMNYNKSWDIAKKLLNKNKTSDEIQKILNYINSRGK